MWIIYQTKAEYGELKHLHSIVQNDKEVTESNYQMTWKELQKVTADRNYVRPALSVLYRVSPKKCTQAYWVAFKNNMT